MCYSIDNRLNFSRLFSYRKGLINGSQNSYPLDAFFAQKIPLLKYNPSVLQPHPHNYLIDNKNRRLQGAGNPTAES
jgi:hypothetical protein